MDLLGGSLILDAAMGTALGSPSHAPAFNLRDPSRVLAIHRAHVAAGADLVLTNTFVGATPEEAAAGVRLARESGARYVGASLYAGLPNLGEQIALLAHADCIWLETATSAGMALRAVEIAARISKTPIAITCSFDAAPLDDLRAAGASAAGYNCSPWPSSFAGADILKPDSAGLSPIVWAQSIGRARLRGGCCGTDARYLTALREIDR
jgi:5-methyltetrahydrofolate--homocysteine methyltransferase